ncbi:hypothetical protein BLS_008634 [Venturia inaequalis]|uniref:Cell wall protein n=1 Tax=Venturia inaequalis TaxID=5025 RepID=A0A8H3UVU0_VENIN|nr:hypothetical protein BLS_008634 [Venturia inaequalis]KAE9972047.1 hypothetical protein EG327_009605 [Venturia inaequalis]KAE9976588.1 hypothetical protein EG328_002549 [Venturia inaequalis]RDI85293.1 hypothetical protein Vi05172_g4843 [Venturia inaequalis]
MRFATLAFTTGAIAQLTVITPVLDKIAADIGTFDTAVNGYTGGDAADVLSSGKKLLDTINSGVTTVKGSSDLSQNDAIQLTTQFQGLQSASEKVYKSLYEKKCNFASAGKLPEVSSNLQDQLTASKALTDAITSKVPPTLQAVTPSFSSGTDTVLQGGIDSFKDTRFCPASPSSAAPTTTSPASTPGPSSPATSTSAPSNGTASTPTVTPTSTRASNSTAAATATASAGSAGISVPAYAGIFAIAALLVLGV